MRKNKPTVALGMIVKDELPQVKALIDSVAQYFDEIYLTVTDRDALAPFQKLFSDPKIHIDFFPWQKDFALARNHNLESIQTDYWMWLDADDTVDLTSLPQVVKEMEADNIDAMFLPYNYAQDDQGNCIALHQRERVIRRKHPFKWVGALHETLISPTEARKSRSDLFMVIHNHPLEEMKKSMERNLEILEAEYPKGDPRITHYLGITYFSLGRYEEAIKLFREHIDKSGWDEESYRSQLHIAHCYEGLGQGEQAMQEAVLASLVMPTYPDAFLLIAQLAFERNEWKDCLEWLKVANSKPIPDTLSIIDPTVYGFRATMLGAMANFQLGRFELAYQLIKEVLKSNSEYPVAKNHLEMFRKEYERKIATDSIRNLTLFMDDKKFDKDFFNILPREMQYDARVTPLRNRAKDPVIWSEKSVVIFCGNTFETWGADTMKQGMGGSEEAVVNLSRQYADAGYTVTIFNTRDDIYQDGKKITYLPWYTFDYRDQFNILVIWRAPELINGVNAKVKLLDMHDVSQEDRVAKYADQYDRICVKSHYHRSLYPSVPDEKFAIIGNGIDPAHFHVEKKKPHSAGYFSAPDRGLLTLLKLWPQIRDQVPDATLIWHYGWNSYVAAMGQDKLYQDVMLELKRLKDQGVTDGGRISHTELANVMAKTAVWLYPTEFPEIHCITALKAQESGMWPVVTDVAALKETVQSGNRLDYTDIYTNPKAQDDFVRMAVDSLLHPRTPKPMQGVYWKDVATKWTNLFGGGNE